MPATVGDYGYFAFDMIERIEQSTTQNDVLDCFSGALKQFGFSSFLITDVPDLATGRKPTFLLNGWTPEWTKMYTQENFYNDDPVAAWGRQTVQPYEWSDVKIDTERYPRAADIMNISGEFGLRKGFVVPIYLPGQPMSAVTMSGERPDFGPITKRALHIISMYAHGRIVALGDNKPEAFDIPLTEGEKEVLLWTAAGKTGMEIAIILGIAEVTVRWRLKQAMTKLNAVNKIQAVVKAIRSKQIPV